VVRHVKQMNYIKYIQFYDLNLSVVLHSRITHDQNWKMTTTLPKEGSSFMPMPGADPPRPCDVNIYNHSVIRQHTNKLNAVQLPTNNKARLTLQTGSHHSPWSTLISAPISFYCTLSENIESLWRSDKANIPAFPYSPTVVLVEVTDDVLLRMVVGASDDRATWLLMLRRREGGGMGVGLSIISQQGGKSPSYPHSPHSKPCSLSLLLIKWRETIATQSNHQLPTAVSKH